MEYDSSITQNYRSTKVMGPSKISSITSQPESYWSMQDSQSRAEYLLVGPDGFKMTDALCVRSVDYDKRIEYLKNLIEKINAGDKYSWLLNIITHHYKFEFDNLKIFKKYYSGRLYFDLGNDLYYQPNSNSN